MLDIFDDLWSFLMDTNLNSTAPVRSTSQPGIRRFLTRNVPHNLFVKKDSDGNVESYKIEIVYTPFKSSDIDVKVEEGNLIVKIGQEKKTEENKEDNIVYHGISSQSYYFKIPMVGIDENAITAKAVDGILTITMPAEKIEKPKAKTITVNADVEKEDTKVEE